MGDRTGFELVEFEYNQHITIRMRPRSIEAKFFGIFASSYLIVPLTPDSCRLLVKVTVRYVRGPLGWFWRVFLPWVDLMMMRRQLLNFKKLSEGMADSAVQPRDQQKE